LVAVSIENKDKHKILHCQQKLNAQRTHAKESGPDQGPEKHGLRCAHGFHPLVPDKAMLQDDVLTLPPEISVIFTIDDFMFPVQALGAKSA
jgi:hypothetical protein